MSIYLSNALDAYAKINGTRLQGLKGAIRYFLSKLVLAANPEGQVLKSRETFMLESGESNCTISRHLNTLEELGWISRKRRFNKSTVICLNPIFFKEILEAVEAAQLEAPAVEEHEKFADATPEEIAAAKPVFAITYSGMRGAADNNRKKREANQNRRPAYRAKANAHFAPVNAHFAATNFNRTESNKIIDVSGSGNSFVLPSNMYDEYREYCSANRCYGLSREVWYREIKLAA